MDRPADHQLRTAAFFEAAQGGDWGTFRSLMADHAVATQHLAGATPMTADELTEWAASLSEAGIDVEYGNPRRHPSGDVVVEQHEVRLTQRDGTVLAGDVCVVLHFGDDGLIEALDEYLDSALFTPD